eukprot:EC840017.1.p4 GENE.EC840017.1~~EC840017.1.p4  ORF type:complete len:61 (+),score=6.76 EC840017.1:474-656(+)
MQGPPALRLSWAALRRRAHVVQVGLPVATVLLDLPQERQSWVRVGVLTASGTSTLKKAKI